MMAISTGITMPRPQKTKPLRPTAQATWNSAERKCATKLAFYAELEKYSAIGNSPAQCAQRNALCGVWPTKQLSALDNELTCDVLCTSSPLLELRGGCWHIQALAG
jgi:hypothetical protein